MINRGSKLAVALAFASAVLAFLWAGPAASQGVWFDIASGEAVTVYCETDSASWIEFPPYPFGLNWPLGTLVYAALEQEPVEGYATSYSIVFYDGGCGCGVDSPKPITYRFHYDEDALAWPEDSTSLYRRISNEWVEVTGVSLDMEANVFTDKFLEPLVGTPTFAVGPSGALREEEGSSWGRVKALYR